MNRTAASIAALSLLFCACHSATAAFTAPTPAQIAAAANNPEVEMAGILSEASSEQAASVVTSVIVKVLALGLNADAQAARITAVVMGAFAAIPQAQQLAFAAALGKAVANSAAISAAVGCTSLIQAAVATAGGPQSGTALAQTFGGSYQAAIETGGSLAGQAQVEAPPVSTVYPGQDR